MEYTLLNRSAELREGDERHRAILQAAMDGFCRTDFEGNIVEVNPAFCRITGYDTRELLRMRLSDLESDPSETGTMGSREEGQEARFETRYRRKEGSPVDVEVSVQCRFHDDGHLVAFVRDITQRKRDDHQVAAARAAAESASCAKSRFLATMSHEIRTPMNGLLGMTQLLEMTELTPEQQDFVSTLKLSGRTLLSLVNDILDLSKIEAGKVDIEVSYLDIRACIKEVILTQQPVIGGKGLELTVDIDPGIPKVLFGDPLRIKQILLNLVNNAGKFTCKGSITVSARMVDQRGDALLLQLCVEDTGTGISPETLDSIFDPYTQGDNARRYEGTGLGLSISSQLAQMMGGEVTVESTPGKGSRFTATIPFFAEEGADPGNEAPREQILWDGPSLRILLVEDDAISAKFALSLLKRLGFEITAVRTGRECLAALQGEPFDLVLMDVQMPQMDGEEAVAALRDMERGGGRRHRVIAVTAHALRGDRDRFREAGFDGYLAKPLEAGELLREIKRVTGTLKESYGTEVRHEQ